MYPEYTDFTFVFPADLESGLESLQSGDIGVRFYSKNINGDFGAETLAEELKTNRTCTGFSIFNCDIGSAGAKYFAEALIKNRTITYMALSHNRIRTDGVVALAESLRRNTTVVAFYLYLNQVSPYSLL